MENCISEMMKHQILLDEFLKNIWKETDDKVLQDGYITREFLLLLK